MDSAVYLPATKRVKHETAFSQTNAFSNLGVESEANVDISENDVVDILSTAVSTDTTEVKENVRLIVTEAKPRMVKTLVNRYDDTYFYTVMGPCAYRVSNIDIAKKYMDQQDWNTLTTSFHKLHDGVTLRYGNYIVAIGSLLPFQDPFKYKVSAIFFDLITDNVLLTPESANLSRPLADFSATVCGNRIYILGGRILSGSFYIASNAVYYFDCKNNTWNKCMNMPEARTGTSFSSDKHIYFVASSFNTEKEIYRFNVRKNYWRIIDTPKKKAKVLARLAL